MTCSRISAAGAVSILVATLFTMASLLSGCSGKKVHAAAPVTVPAQPPVPVAAPETTKSPASIPAPNTPAPKNPAPSNPPADLTPQPDKLKKPAVPPPTAEPARPEAPQISPQLSPADQAQLEKETNQLVSDSEQNLHRADGRDLNASQKDMVDKINGWLDQSRDAVRTSDWARAKNLAQKAYLLSIELIKTL
ncbi:MAG TPA: hypothetical protein VGR81_08205 [Candidatus Acidoferrales bacterium]|nr:hypothetical protein [Candidatus Acidoferrales bacterium]